MIEPSDGERSEWPECTENYVGDLEQQVNDLQSYNAELEAENERLQAVVDARQKDATDYCLKYNIALNRIAELERLEEKWALVFDANTVWKYCSDTTTNDSICDTLDALLKAANELEGKE